MRCCSPRAKLRNPRGSTAESVERGSDMAEKRAPAIPPDTFGVLRQRYRDTTEQFAGPPRRDGMNRFWNGVSGMLLWAFDIVRHARDRNREPGRFLSHYIMCEVSFVIVNEEAERHNRSQRGWPTRLGM